MKILLTADPEIPVPPKLYGGIERVIESLVHGYLESGHDVTLMAHPDSSVPCRLIPWKGVASQGLGSTLRNTASLFTQVMTEKYDVIHSFSRLAYLMPVLPMAIPKIMSYQREPTLPQISKAAKLSRSGSLVFTGCSNYISNQIKPFAPATTVYNCAPLSRFEFKSEVADDAPLIFLGRIEPIKGTHIAIEIAKRAGRKLIIAGNIPKEGEGYFEEKVRPFLNERINYVGPVNDEQKNELLGSAVAFLMPIQWNEPFGIVMAEAMACGTPVIGFPFGSVPEVITDGVTGFICENTVEVVARIKDLRSLSRKRVREEAELRFSNDRIVGDYLRLYDYMINSKRKGVVKVMEP